MASHWILKVHVPLDTESAWSPGIVFTFGKSVMGFTGIATTVTQVARNWPSSGVEIAGRRKKQKCGFCWEEEAKAEFGSESKKGIVKGPVRGCGHGESYLWWSGRKIEVEWGNDSLCYFPKRSVVWKRRWCGVSFSYVLFCENLWCDNG